MPIHPLILLNFDVAVERGRDCIFPTPGRGLFALPAATYQQQGSMPAQHAAPATQQVAANAVTEKAEAPIVVHTLK